MSLENCVDTINNEFSKKNILVIGDLMVDRYISGKVRKISPEAPVPVLDYTDKKFVAGGASNVVNNLLGLGAKVHVAGVIADDAPGKWLKNELANKGAIITAIYESDERPTTIKTRYTTKGIQLLRVDKEETKDIPTEAKEHILNYLVENLEDIDAVVFSDYVKGVLKDKTFTKRLIGVCRDYNIFVAVDSKTDCIGNYEGADIMTPNADEVSSAVGIKMETDEDVTAAGELYLKDSGTKALLLTRGENGIAVFEQGKARVDFPAKDVEVYDVSGAGDTVISTITIARICDLDMAESVELGNIAAGVVITKRGTVPIKKEELLRAVNEN